MENLSISQIKFILDEHLKSHYSITEKNGEKRRLTIDDVEMTDVKGYLQLSVPDYTNRKTPFYPTIGIENVFFGNREKNGRFISPYKFWFLLKEKEVI